MKCHCATRILAVDSTHAVRLLRRQTVLRRCTILVIELIFLFCILKKVISEFFYGCADLKSLKLWTEQDI